MSESTLGKIRIGVSACLTGEPVRYDGRSKHDEFVTGELARRFELVPVCPEVEIGMSVPRETIRLEGDPGRPSLIAPVSGRDWSQQMYEWSRNRSRGLVGDDLCGFVFKKNSPSCGVFSVPVIQPDDRSLNIGRGFFAAEFIRTHPLMPVEEEGRLDDTAHRESFLERVYAYHAIHGLFEGVWVAEKIREFHRRHRYVLLTHDPDRSRELDELVETVADFRPSAFRDRYREIFMTTIGRPTTLYSHLEVFQDLAGRLQGCLDAEQQRHLIETIEAFRTGQADLTEPVSLLRQYIEENQVADVCDQVYLDPPWLRAS